MRRKPPTPVSKAFLICREIWQDQRTGDTMLLGFVRHVQAMQYPFPVQLEVFTRWTSAHGKYVVTLQLQDLAGNVVSQNVLPTEFDMPDPLQAFDLILGHCQLEFPEPGKYDVVMLANDEEIARDAFFAYLLREEGAAQDQ
jgi:hypothetical protein